MPDAETTAQVLRNGSTHEADKPNIAEAVKCLLEHGLIKTTVSEYVSCANVKDRDYKYVRNRSCRGRIELNDDLDEDGDEFVCPECERIVYPRQKARHKIVRIEVVPEKVAGFMDWILETSGLSRKQMHPWVWRVDTPKGETKLIVADYCDMEYIARDWALQNKACFVVVDAAGCSTRFLPEEWITWERFADIVCESDVLAKALLRSAEVVADPKICVSAPVYSATVRPIISGGSSQKKASDEEAERKVEKSWPDPEEHTVAKFWTREDGVFCFSTRTQGHEDGRVEFAPVNNKPTNQMQLMNVLLFKHPTEVSLATLIEQVYPESKEKVRNDGAELARTLKNLRTLISDVRNKKMTPAGINPEILPSIDIETQRNATICLRLAHVRNLDDEDERRPKNPA